MKEIVRLHPALTISLAIPLAALLSGCLTTSDDAIRQHLAKTCLAIEGTHLVIQGIHSAHPLPPRIIDPEIAAYTEAKDFCDHPEKASTVAAVQKVVTLSLAILRALDAAKKVEVSND